MSSPDLEMLRRLLDASPDGHALVRDGEVVWVSAGLARLAGEAQPETLVGKPWLALFEERGFGLPDGHAVVECGLARTGLDPCPVSVDRVEPAGAVAAYRVRDLRTLRTLEDEVLRSGRRLHALNRELAALRERIGREAEERGDLLTVLSHELRTPATVINGYNRLLLSGDVGPLNEKQRHFLSESQKSCRRLDHVLGNLIEAAGKGTATGPLEVRESSIEALFAGLHGMLTALLADRSLRLESDCASHLPRVRFDPRRLEQVLVNLVTNASRFAPPGSAVRLESRAAPRRGRKGLEVAVCDRGPGIAAAERERVFEPYVQGERSRQGGGLGLGLAISRRIVDAHGGAIWVCDDTEPGARVVFWLPAIDPRLEEIR